MKHRYEPPRPSLTVDVVAVRGVEADREILFIRRGREPFAGAWALPGGFVDEDEPLEDAARRELAEETALSIGGDLVQVGVYGDPGRDPRGWTVSVVFMVRCGTDDSDVFAGDDADEAVWFPVWDLPELAFDHEVIVHDALKLVRHSDRREGRS